MTVEVRCDERGAWCVVIDGKVVSTHASHSAARITAQRHLAALSEKEDR